MASVVILDVLGVLGLLAVFFVELVRPYVHDGKVIGDAARLSFVM